MLVSASGIAGAPAANFQRGTAEATSFRRGRVRENAAVEDFLSGGSRGVPQFLDLSDPGGVAGTIHGGAPPAGSRWHRAGLRPSRGLAPPRPGGSGTGKEARALSQKSCSARVL